MTSATEPKKKKSSIILIIIGILLLVCIVCGIIGIIMGNSPQVKATSTVLLAESVTESITSTKTPFSTSSLTNKN
jgi:flagellar basal body-associated protein FliL